MALFKAYSPDAEVSGRIVYPVVEGVPDFKAAIQSIFQVQGITDVTTECWYPHQFFLNALEDVFKKFGPNTVFAFGKLVTESYPHQFDDIRSALLAVDDIYKSTHRNGDAGFIELIEFSYETRNAKMRCHVPYPPEFQRGVLVSMIRKYKNTVGLVNVANQAPSSDESGADDVYQFQIRW